MNDLSESSDQVVVLPIENGDIHQDIKETASGPPIVASKTPEKEREEVTLENGKFISSNHYERIIEELKCPGCASPMKAPIRLCSTGHSICHNCTNIFEVCPLCKDEFTTIRSLTLEALASKAYFRCINATAGCTVRLQIDLLDWHEKQCLFKTMKCFLGRVWGNCSWKGREVNWKDHIFSVHSDKIYLESPAEIECSMDMIRPLAGYYVFNMFDEIFNFYQIYDKNRILWTMTCTSTYPDRKLCFSYDVEIYSPEDESIIISQRYPCHSEFDKDILQEGTCVTVSISQLSRFVGKNKKLHYRVYLNELKNVKKFKCTIKESQSLPINFTQTEIKGVNMKNIPSEAIVTRKVDVIVTAPEAKDEIKNEFIETPEDSDTDSELEAFINQKFGTPQLHFNRKYLQPISPSETTTSSSQSQSGGSPESTITKKNKLQSLSSSFRKSMKNLKTDIVEMSSFKTKRSSSVGKIE